MVILVVKMRLNIELSNICGEKISFGGPEAPYATLARRKHQRFGQNVTISGEWRFLGAPVAAVVSEIAHFRRNP